MLKTEFSLRVVVTENIECINTGLFDGANKAL
jgi:hypothetical protein